jgi:hypothetical protein
MPASIMDFCLGDSLLAQARVKFTSSNYGITVAYPQRLSSPIRPFPQIETMFGADDIMLKVEIIYPPMTATRASTEDRLKYLRDNCQFRMHLKEILSSKPSGMVPGIIFGPSKGGYHSPLIRDGNLILHSYTDLEALAASTTVIVGLKESNDFTMVRYEVSPCSFISIIEAFEERIREISTLSSIWVPKIVSSIHTDRPSIPCDRSFLSQYILVGNIDPNSFKSHESVAALKERLRICAAYQGCPGADDEDLNHLDEPLVGHIRPPNLGIDENLCIRSLKVIKLKQQIKVGINLDGGLRLVDRIHINQMDTEAPPIYYTRQYLSDKEASTLLLAESTKLDTCVLLARRLTKRTELDDLVRRSLKTTLEAILKTEVFVWIATARHRWNGPNNTEESFLIASIGANEGE